MTLATSMVLVVATTSIVYAQSAPAAEALFVEGRTLIKTGKLEAGCAKLAASERLESSVGTLLDLGDCREKLGQTASAWAAFRKAEAMAKRSGDDKKRQFEARRRAQELESDLSNLVFQVGKSTPGIVIKHDGEALDAAVLSMPVPVDPGTHTIIAEAPGHKPFKTEVSIGKGGRRYVVVPTLEKVPERIAPPAASPVVVRPPPPATGVVVVAPPPRYVTVNETWSGTRKGAVVLGLAGAAALGGGIYFGARASDLEAQSDTRCPDTTCNDAEGLRLNEDARTTALRANILFIAGGAAVAAATMMWFAGAPDEHTVLAPAIASDRIGASLVGRF